MEPPVLDGQVGDAPRGVHHRRPRRITPQQRSGGARVQTTPARPAMVLLERSVRVEIQVQEQQPQKEVGTPLRVDQHRVLPEPADLRTHGQLPLQNGAGIHIDTSLDGTFRCLDPPVKLEKPLLDGAVVILAARVAGDHAPRRISRHPGGVFLEVLITDHDHRPDRRQGPPEIGAPSDGVLTCEITHLSVPTVLHPLSIEVHVGARLYRGYSYETEAQLSGLLLEAGGERHTRYSLPFHSTWPPLIQLRRKM